MRRGNDNSIISEPDGNFIGFNLGSDYVSEHEWGIKELKRSFGIPDDISVYGLDRRKITKLPGKYIYGQHMMVPAGGFALRSFEFNYKEKRLSRAARLTAFGLVYAWHNTDVTKLSELKMDEYTHERGQELVSAWSEGDFGILVTKKHHDKLDELIKAFGRLDVAMWLGGGGVFRNAGLVIAIASRIPDEFIVEWEKHDREQHGLRQEFEASGIEKILKDAGKEWFSLSPRREEDGKMVIWLNPHNQRHFRAGWYSVDQLKLWAEGRGPVIKSVREVEEWDRG